MSLTIEKQADNNEPVPNYAGYKLRRDQIREAYLFLREHNHTVPSDILDFMLEVSLREMHP